MSTKLDIKSFEGGNDFSETPTHAKFKTDTVKEGIGKTESIQITDSKGHHSEPEIKRMVRVTEEFVAEDEANLSCSISRPYPYQFRGSNNDRQQAKLQTPQSAPNEPKYVNAIRGNACHDTSATAQIHLQQCLKLHYNTVFDANRLGGRRIEESYVDEDTKHSPFSVVDRSGRPVIKVTHKTPEEIPALVLGKRMEIAETITVAGTITGLTILPTIDEHTAATAIAYGLE
ncbi:ATPase with role in protein import into the ER [Tulasnella sp. 408]|nr:ATPase with role in protein import into the ER [Tulasnella sp. 408]